LLGDDRLLQTNADRMNNKLVNGNGAVVDCDVDIITDIDKDNNNDMTKITGIINKGGVFFQSCLDKNY
jgi:hypothetical protein